MNKKTLFFLLATFLLSTAQSYAIENRCGWIDNPTPGNMWLIDKDGEWTISMQGQGPMTDNKGLSLEKIPEISSDDSRFIRINGVHGFYCGCFRVLTDTKDYRIKRILSGNILELKQCMEDPMISSKIPLDLKK